MIPCGVGDFPPATILRSVPLPGTLFIGIPYSTSLVHSLVPPGPAPLSRSFHRAHRRPGCPVYLPSRSGESEMISGPGRLRWARPVGGPFLTALEEPFRYPSRRAAASTGLSGWGEAPVFSDVCPARRGDP